MKRKFTSETLKTVPGLPGVYLFNDAKGKLLYVGKAVNLRNRLRNYLQPQGAGLRIQKMVSQIDYLEYIVTRTEVEALLLENSFIKNNKPVYNILLRDDKTYPYILITEEMFPRALIVRRKSRTGQTFGPFPSARAARETVRQLHQFFKIRNCDYDLESKKVERCLQYHLGRCEAPCDRSVTPEHYASGVERAKMFLKGATDELIEILNREMVQASEQLNFERAAHFRDLLGLVNKVRHHQKVTKFPDAKLDVIGFQRTGLQCSLIILTIRGGTINRSKQFHFESAPDEPHDLVSHLAHYYIGHADPPNELVLRDPESFGLLSDALQAAELPVIRLKEPQKGYKKHLLEMAESNARLHIVDEEGERVNALGDVLSNLLGQEIHPRRIEGFDISNTQGQLSVAAMVSFLDGKPDKKNYRIYKIKTVEGPDDYASMREAVYRRYRRLKEEQADLPDLILIDGGPGQLKAAYQSLEALALHDLPIVSLAKREELIFHLKAKEPAGLAHTDPALQLLMKVRDESHRFGLNAHRKRRTKAMVQSALEAVPGLGPNRIKKLLHVFGSVKGIETASLEQLQQVIGPKVGKTTYLRLKGQERIDL